ncbi:hypothetical protein PV11_03378 [Exophiala sideris]|uniref:SNF7 family protein n=1 Tax=Exophiala sideris TaxID=1016849 RepID=A0A0D1WGG4_9EURO|nr:hypothetical protein PV11_03378 [Exophiala sideris]
MSPLLDWLVENEPSFRKTRLPSLYSDLTVQKSTNPEGYAANVTAWASALTRASLAGQLPLEQRLILQTSDDLLSALASAQYGRPSGLGSVLDDCMRQGKMVDLHDFLASEKSIYSRSWIPSPWAVLRWSLRQVGIVGTGSYEVNGYLRKGSLVLVPALEEVLKHVQRLRDRSAQGLTDRIMSRETFLKELNDLIQSTLSDQDVAVLLRYLSRDKQALTYDEATIKFKSPTSTTPEPITHEDRSIATLKTLISNLTLQIANLNTRIATLQARAQTSVKTGNKTSALSALRSKKLAEQSLTSRTDTLHQLEQVYAKLEAAADQVEIIAAMQASAGALKTLNNKVGGVERVEDVLDTLREEMGKTDEVSGVIAEPLDSNAVLDEGEVDDELESMEREERNKREGLDRAEKERKDAQEAEATRRRLADLDAVGQEVRSKEQTANPVEQELSRSVEKMQKLDLDGRQQPQVAEGAS